MSTAYLLAREGKAVVVLDDGPIGGGMTARTTAHLTNALDNRYFGIERLHGKEGARLAAASHTAAIKAIEAIVKREAIRCEFARLDGFLFVPSRESTKVLDDELAAVHRAGLTDIEKVERAPWDSYDTGPTLRFPHQAQFHPLKYLAGLAKAIKANGGRIHTQTHATSIAGGKKARIETRDGGAVTASSVVVATNTPVNDLIAIHTKQASYQTYVIGVPRAEGFSSACTLLGYTGPLSLPTNRDGWERNRGLRRIDCGRRRPQDGSADDGAKRFAALERWTRRRFPMTESIDYRSSGEVMEPVDGIGFIGRNPLDAKNVYVATGDSGNGMTHGTIAGLLITDLILKRKNAWAPLYDPSRITLRALPRFIRENLNVAVQYTDVVFAGVVKSVEEISPGSGAVVARSLHKVAVYRDPKGEIHERSAVCPHLGGIVNWNTLENTWDCPCHGSRFDAAGKVIQEPANSDLAEINAE
jgi:glycine/D-amino acid oxidase-like deaminating enzyme/nitrite reductase/ring-hydroxylating ferredoxin subunit